MQQSLSKLISRYQRMNVIVLFIFVAAMLFEFYALHETTQKYEQGQLLSQVVDNYKMHYINLSHEYSDILTLKDAESHDQYQYELNAIENTRKQLAKIMLSSRYRHYPEIHDYVQSLNQLIDGAVIHFRDHSKFDLVEIREQLSYIETHYTKPINEKATAMVAAIADISDNTDYTFTNFLLLVGVQTVLTLSIIFMFNRSANNNILKPISNISNTIRDIQNKKYISTDYQPSSYMVTELALLQNDLSTIAMGYMEMQVKEQGMRMLQERLEMVPVAAHNIIGPISSIKSISEELQYNFFTDPDSKGQLQDIDNICDGLVRWLRNLLFLFKQTSLNQQTTRLDQTLITAINFSNHLIKKKKIKLTVADIPHAALANIDKELVEQSIACIVTNAADAVKRVDGSIDITYTDDGDSHIITVIDNGIGLSKNFFDGDTKTTKRAGHGIGVAFARNVAMLHKPALSINFANNDNGVPGANVKFIIPKQV
ncbi:MAG: sensor histidine kinase [Methylophilus sp.]|uniref:sensor histidine kinase n=1 Tax=Methylophilus sp. TaxID=29541 RepID=UPI003FA16E2D